MECGPNYRNDEDSEALRRKRICLGDQISGSSQESGVTQVVGNVTESSASSSSAPAPAQSERVATARSRVQRPIPIGKNSSQEVLVKSVCFSRRSELKLTVFLDRLDKFNALIDMLRFDSHHTPPCQIKRSYFPVKPRIETKVQHMFINIYQSGRDALKKNDKCHAMLIFGEVINALDKYPRLYDSQKRHELLEIAAALESFGLRARYEHVLGRLTDVNEPSVQSLDEDPCQLLADSLAESSKTSKELLENMWCKSKGDTPPSDLAVNPLQRAALFSSPRVVLAILARSTSLHPHQGMGSQLPAHEHLEISESFAPQIPDDVHRFRGIVDVRDFRGRTPLFSAAEDGCESCIFTLLQAHADPNSRDHDSHTVLEVASRSGNIRIVEQLIAAGGRVDPDLSDCASTPLQAAVESQSPNSKVICKLLDRGAKVYDRRMCDNKNAIDIAQGKGCEELVRYLQRRAAIDDHASSGPFSFHDNFTGSRPHG